MRQGQENVFKNKSASERSHRYEQITVRIEMKIK